MKIKLLESYELTPFFSKNYLEQLFQSLILWKYLSKCIFVSEKPYKPSQYMTKFRNLDVELSDDELNAWVVDYDFELRVPTNFSDQILENIQNICDLNGLKFFIERMPSGRYILTIMQFLPVFVQDFCSKIVEFDKSGFSSIHKGTRFFLKLSFSKEQDLLLNVFFIGATPKKNLDVTIFSNYLMGELSKKLNYGVEIEFLKIEKTKFGESLLYSVPY